MYSSDEEKLTESFEFSPSRYSYIDADDGTSHVVDISSSFFVFF